ncbi:MAG: dockerin type I repeat-containing protein [Oscillospiraceae bacterium]|nr:dockerin type I repeat-containing protein [Oscillospiraceae bacterium]
MKRKQSVRILSFFLALLLLATASSVGASAIVDYSRPDHYSKGKAMFTMQQCATMVCDFVDSILAEANIELNQDIVVTTIHLDLRSIDGLRKTLPELMDNGWVGFADFLTITGDVAKLNIGNIRNMPYRDKNKGAFAGAEANRDVEVLRRLFMFLGDNEGHLGNIADGSFKWGIIPTFLPDNMSKLTSDLPGFLKDTLMPALDPENKYPGATADQLVGNMIGDMLFAEGGLLPDFFKKDENGKYAVQNVLDMNTQNTEHFGGVGADGGAQGYYAGNTLNIAQEPTYQLLRDIINAALSQFLMPMLVDLLAPLVLDDDGNLKDDIITTALWGVLVTGEMPLLIQPGEVPHKPGATPKEMLEDSLNYIVFGDFLNQFIERRYSGTSTGLFLKPNTSGDSCTSALQHWLDDLLVMVVDTLDGLGLLGDVMLDSNYLAQLPLNGKVAYVAKVLIPMLADYVYIPDNVDSLPEILTYFLVDYCSDIMPDKKYFFYSAEDLTPANGGAQRPSTPTQLNAKYDGVYVVLGDLLRYLLEPLFPSLKLPQNVTFENMLGALAGWLLGEYGGLFRSQIGGQALGQLSGWDKLDRLLFATNTTGAARNSGVLHRDYLPLNIANAPNATQTLLQDRILGGVLTLDFEKLFSVFQSNDYNVGQASQSDFRKPLSQFVLNLVNRVLSGALKLPDGTFVLPYNSANCSTIESLLSGANAKSNLRALITGLSKGLQNQATVDSLISTALPLLASLMGIWDQNSYLPDLRRDTNGIPEDAEDKDLYILNKTTNDLKTLLSAVYPLEQTYEYDQFGTNNLPGYIAYGAENFTVDQQWHYKLYDDARSTALDALNRIADEDPDNDPTQYEIDNAWYILNYYTYGAKDKVTGITIVDGVRGQNSVERPKNRGKDGLVFTHLQDLMKRVNDQKHVEANYTKSSWDVYNRAYQYAFRLLDAYFDGDEVLEGTTISQAAITQARHMLASAEKQLKLFRGWADYAEFRRVLLQLKEKELDISYLTPQSQEDLADILGEAAAFYSDYSLDEQNVVNDMSHKMDEVYKSLKGLMLLHPDQKTKIKSQSGGGQAYYTVAGYGDDFEVTRIWFGLPYGVARTNNGSYVLSQYISSFNADGEMDAISSTTVQATQGSTANLRWVGTGAVVLVYAKADESCQDAAVTCIFGDVNGDAFANSQDSLLVKRFLAGQSSLTRTLAAVAADVDHNGVVELADALLIQDNAAYLRRIEQANVNLL